MGLCLGVPAADDKGAHEAFEMKKVYSKKTEKSLHFTVNVYKDISSASNDLVCYSNKSYFLPTLNLLFRAITSLFYIEN